MNPSPHGALPLDRFALQRDRLAKTFGRRRGLSLSRYAERACAGARRYNGRMDFEWDPEKDTANLAKHGVAFAEAMTIFGDPFEVTIRDPKHSAGEFRFISMGFSSESRTLVVSYTEREGHRTRIISARATTPKERRQYESRNPK